MFSLYEPVLRAGGISRRQFLSAGAIGGGLTLARLLQAEQAAGIGKSHKAVINIHLDGGPPQMDMIDLKPQAPAEIRGEFKPVATKVPGIQICELLPKSAAVMDKWSIVRSLHHRPEDGDLSHSRGDQVVFTGYPPGPNADENVHPSVGSVVAKQLQE